MKLLSLLMLPALLLPLAAGAQTAPESFTVKGCVVDSITKAGEPYATISITKKDTTDKALKLAVTNVNGQFSVSVKHDAGKQSAAAPDAAADRRYVLTVSSIGRRNIVRDFTVAPGQKTVNLDTLLISDNKNELNGVEVVAQKPLVKSDIDKIEYNIEEDPDSKTNSVIEMLRKVPLVTVDGEDNIKVNGNSSFKVFVNGKPNSMMTKNPKEVLKSMPASSIKRIEVITNPGPKYDAEGIGGILNIITVGRGIEGYTATFTASAGTRGLGGGAFATVKKGKLTVSGRYNYTRNDNPRTWSGSNLTTTDEALSSSSSDVENRSTAKNHNNFHSGSLEASYDIDSLRLVSLSLNLWGGDTKSHSEGTTVGSAPATGDMLYRYTTPSHAKSTWSSIEGGIDYQRLFKLKDRMLTLSYKINSSPESSDSSTAYDDKDAAADWQDFLRRLRDMRNDGSTNSTEHTFQVDYTTPIGKIHTLETGMKYIIRDNRSENDRYMIADDDADDYTFDNDHSVHYKHENDILAAYLGYRIKIKKFSARLGARYEHTDQSVRYTLGRGEDFKKSFNDIVPSLSLGWKLSDMMSLKASYNMRIYRPGIWYLNPYLDDSDPTNINQGNPDLDSEKSHSFALTFSNFTSKLSLNVQMSYRFTDNSIEYVSRLVNDNDIEGLRNPTGKSVLYDTYANIGKVRSASLYTYVNWNMTKTTRIYSNFNGWWSYMSDGTSLKNRGWQMFIYAGAQQTLPKDWTISAGYYAQTPTISLQGRGNSFTQYSMSVSKSFLKKRLTLSAYAIDFFTKYHRWDSSTESIGFKNTSFYKGSNRRFGVSVSYRIGELKAGVKKAERSIENDDVKGKKE